MINRIRLKLTVTNTVVVFTLMMCVAVIVYVIVNVNSISATDSELADMAYSLKRYVSLGEGKSISAELSEEYSAFKSKTERSYVSYGMWDYSEKLLIGSVNGSSAPPEALGAIRRLIFTEQPAYERVIDEADGPYYIHEYRFEDYDLRVCTAVFSNDSGRIRFVQTYTDMKTQSDMVMQVRNAVLISAAVGVVLSFISGYFIAGRAIIPIEQSVIRQNEFFADASHELRTPITIIRTNLDVVLSSEEESVASQKQWLDNAYRETTRMQKLVSDFLTIAKSDLNQDSLVITNFDLAELSMQVINKFEAIAQGRGIELIFTCECEPIMINADRSGIDQLETVLLDNAIRYSGEGKHIHLSLAVSEGFVRLSVADEGIGIDKNELENIFERFYRADKARSRSEGGTGLGLAIAKRIVSLHSGTIRAESIKGKGTTITVELALKG